MREYEHKIKDASPMAQKLHGLLRECGFSEEEMKDMVYDQKLNVIRIGGKSLSFDRNNQYIGMAEVVCNG